MNSTVWRLVTGEYPPQHGGVGDYSAQLAAGLAREGHEVHVWCTRLRAAQILARASSSEPCYRCQMVQHALQSPVLAAQSFSQCALRRLISRRVRSAARR
jgi:hypothetical protein